MVGENTASKLAGYTAEWSGTPLRDDIFYDMALVVGQVEIAPSVFESEAVMLEAQQGEHRGVEVVDLDGFLDGMVSATLGIRHFIVGCS
jgi:hypothetical protein